MLDVATIRPGSPRAWIVACRPATLTAAIVPVLVGTAVAIASGCFRPGAAVAALLGAVLIQIATNFANDVFDHEKGADGPDRLGPVRAAASGLLGPRDIRAGMALSIALAVVAGGYLTAVAGWPVVVIGVASIAAGVAYTGGPYPLGYHGLGDPFVFGFFGLVAVAGTVFVETGSVPALAFAAAVPVGALATAVLVVNNVRDRVSDARAGKRTLAVRFGRRAAVLEYAALLGLAGVVPVGIALDRGSPWPLLPLATIPFAGWLVQRLVRHDGRELNGVLTGTAKLLLVHGVLLAVGVALGGR